MIEDKIKDAFFKAKQDIKDILEEIKLLKQELVNIKESILKVNTNPTDRHTDKHNFQTMNPVDQTTDIYSTDNSTYNYPLEGLKSKNNAFSTRNGGVSTDRQTDQQTDNSTGNKGVKVRFNIEKGTNREENNLQNIAEAVETIDDLQQEIRRKIKSLTKQELIVFASIYQLQEEGNNVDYFLLSAKLHLTESSIRD